MPAGLNCCMSPHQPDEQKIEMDPAADGHALPQPESRVTRQERSIARMLAACANKLMSHRPGVKSRSLRNLYRLSENFSNGLRNCPFPRNIAVANSLCFDFTAPLPKGNSRRRPSVPTTYMEQAVGAGSYVFDGHPTPPPHVLAVERAPRRSSRPTMLWISEALDRVAASHVRLPRRVAAGCRTDGAGGLGICRRRPHQRGPGCVAMAGRRQTSDGSVPPLPSLSSPGWPTPQAMLAWAAVSKLAGESRDFNRDAAQKWLLSVAGLTGPRIPEIGHDTSLAGWPWVVGTHSWQEPTAWSVLALKAVGLNDHPRTREGVRMLVDRFLESGGCNYGNTAALGQVLRPHVEPTGLTLVALGGENIQDPRLGEVAQIFGRLAFGADHADIAELRLAWLDGPRSSTIGNCHVGGNRIPSQRSTSNGIALVAGAVGAGVAREELSPDSKPPAPARQRAPPEDFAFRFMSVPTENSISAIT